MPSRNPNIQVKPVWGLDKQNHNLLRALQANDHYYCKQAYTMAFNFSLSSNLYLAPNSISLAILIIHIQK